MLEMEEMVDHLIKISVIQIAQEAGFEGAKRSALNTFTDIVKRYIQEIGENAAKFAASASRTESNWHDLAATFQEMGVDVEELMSWHEGSDKVPFHYSLPRIPLPKKVTLVQPSTAMDVKKKAGDGSGSSSSSSSSGTTNEEEVVVQKPHVPPFLPAFPDKRTYEVSPIFVERETDIRKIRKRKVDQNLKVEQALTRMHREAAQGFSVNDQEKGKSKEKQVLLPRNYKQPSRLLVPVGNRTPYWGSVL